MKGRLVAGLFALGVNLRGTRLPGAFPPKNLQGFPCFAPVESGGLAAGTDLVSSVLPHIFFRKHPEQPPV